MRLRRTGMDRAQYEGGLWRGGSIVAFCCPGDEIIICDNRSACRSIAVYARTTHARQPSLVGFPLLLLLTACCCTTTTTIPHAAASANAACNACVPLVQAGVFCVVVFCASVKSSTRNNYKRCNTHGLPCTTENMAAPGPPRSLSTCRHFT